MGINSKRTEIIKKDLNNYKAIKKAFERANSLTLSVLVEVISSHKGVGLGEKQACTLLNINYKIFREYLDKPHLKDAISRKRAIVIKATLNRARKYRATVKHERTIRVTKRKYRKLSVD